MSRTRIMLVDDHAVVRMGFRLLLQTTHDIDVVGEACSGEEACRLYPALDPDVVVMDLNMDGIGGIEATRRILAHHGDARILVLSAHADASHPVRVLNIGALGYLCKRSAPEVLVEAIREIARGRQYVDADIARLIAGQSISGESTPAAKLSPREFDVFLHLARGKSVNQIAATLNLGASTVGTHLYNIKQKLEASNQAELTLIAVRHGLLED